MAKVATSGVFMADYGKMYLVRCPECHRENWGPAVSSGMCAWCGFDANKEEEVNAESGNNSNS